MAEVKKFLIQTSFEAMRTINKIADLPSEAFAHSFQERTELNLGRQTLRYLPPADISNDQNVKVVFFKSSLNTGWDCPRAEVMMSFRKATDSTLIAQLVGRMVRTPLARRVVDNEFLNMVTLFLPHYDETGLKRVVEELTRSDPEILPPVSIEEGNNVSVLPKRKHCDDIFESLSKIPSYTVPKSRKTKGVKRLMKLARLLANDEIFLNANERAIQRLLTLLKAEHKKLSKKLEFKSFVESQARLQGKI